MRRLIRYTDVRLTDGKEGDVVQMWDHNSQWHTQLFVLSRIKGDIAILNAAAYRTIADAKVEVCVPLEKLRRVGHLDKIVDISTPFGGTFGLPVDDAALAKKAT